MKEDRRDRRTDEKKEDGLKNAKHATAFFAMHNENENENENENGNENENENSSVAAAVGIGDNTNADAAAAADVFLDKTKNE